VKHFAVATAFAALVLAAALASGSSKRAASLGGAIASLTALASLLGMGRAARRPQAAMKGALVVMVVVFLVRIVLVALGTAFVARGGESVVAFIVAFFVPYFVFSGIEISYLNSLRNPGQTA
jgi:hypothetical protein